jgi:hypothetical protein
VKKKSRTGRRRIEKKQETANPAPNGPFLPGIQMIMTAARAEAESIQGIAL